MVDNLNEGRLDSTRADLTSSDEFDLKFLNEGLKDLISINGVIDSFSE